MRGGSEIGGYSIEQVIGRGGMGTVYLARHPRLPRSVALKVMTGMNEATDPELSRRFEREADIIARLEHPGIVAVFDRGVDDGQLWIAMQYIRGTDATNWDASAHAPADTVAMLSETAAALDYAHSCGVLHRDVKPANILIADAEAHRESRAVLTDFGIARLTDTASTQLTATGSVTATLAYASPEQLSGEVVDHRSDQYSLACTLFAMLAGQPPFVATNPGQVIMGHLMQPVPRLTGVRPDLPPTVDAVLERAMAKRPDERFASCGEFLATMRAALDGRHIAARFAPTVFNAPAHAMMPSMGPLAGPGPHANPVMREAEPPSEIPVELEPPKRPVAALVSALATLVVALAMTCVTVISVILAFEQWDPKYATETLVGLGVYLLATAVWAGAGLLLLSGRRSGQVLTIFCALVGAAFAGFILIVNMMNHNIVGLPLFLFSGLLIASGIALPCALTSTTRRWITHGTLLAQRARELTTFLPM
ncbi:serine/threonine-protein kinase [Nocardia callitridis]|uniref:non-specific serine/threonine protein kinase n=1 Tax=Nocardia callitridis TaxID=648753 RepID=A0ABP9JYK5_9NOCA